MATSIIKNPLEVKQLTPTYDATKIQNVRAFQFGKIVQGSFEIKAGVLSAGYNAINIHIADWLTIPVSSCSTSGTVDDSKNFYFMLATNTLMIRATSSNSAAINVFFSGLTT